jgi:hypothetical protein
LDAARVAGEYVLVASHHPSADFDRFAPGDVVGTQEFRAALAAMPGVIAHLCGHTHRHRVSRIEGPHPYLEIETSSLIDYPQEGRVFDVYYDHVADQVRLTGEVFGHAEAPTRLSAESLRRATIDAGFFTESEPEWSSHKEFFPGMGMLGSGSEHDKRRTLVTPSDRYGRAEDRSIEHTVPKRAGGGEGDILTGQRG